MLRILCAAIVLTSVLQVHAAPPPPSIALGLGGMPAYANYAWNAGTNAKEPSVGVAWGLPGGISPSGTPDTGTTALYSSGLQQYRLAFDDSKAPPTLLGGVTAVGSPTNVANVANGDPLLFTDHRTGRTWAGGWILDPTAQAVPCAAMMFTDNNGGAWTQMTDTCSLPATDHPTIGAGPWPAGYQPRLPTTSRLHPSAVYYCAQGTLSAIATGSYTNCWVSEDGGLTFIPGETPDPGAQCTLFNGRIRVAPDGTAYLPMYRCNGLTSLLVTSDAAQSWALRSLPFPGSGTGEFDPSVAPTLESGWIYLGQAELGCACIALSKDGGLTWEDVGQGNGAAPGTKYFNVGATAYDANGNPVALQRFNFASVVAGDDQRAAFTFLGATGNAAPGACNAQLVWHLYVSTTYDAGRTWLTVQATPDPVQVGGIWSQGGTSACRNMLDFNDAVIDAYGRVLAAYTDGCPNPCATALGGQSTGVQPALARQYTGCGLLRKYDASMGSCQLAVTKTRPKCDPETAPTVEFEVPRQGQAVEDPSLLVFGSVDRHRQPSPIHADANGPYSTYVNYAVALGGTAWCGTGNGQQGTYSCEWFALTGNAAFTNPTACSTAATYGGPGVFGLELRVTDLVSGLSATETTTVTVRLGAPVGGGTVPPPPPPPLTKMCVDDATLANGVSPSVGPEPDDDSWSSQPFVRTNFASVNSNQRLNQPALNVYEIHDVCADEQKNPNQLVITILADLSASPAGVDSPINYLLYLDAKAATNGLQFAQGSVSNAPGSANDPSLVVTMTRNGPVGFRPDTRTHVPPSWIKYTPGAPGTVEVTIPLPHAIAPSASGTHRVRVEVPGVPVYVATPVSAHCTWWSSQFYLPFTTGSSVCVGGFATAGFGTSCVSTGAPCGAATTCYGASCQPGNPYCFGMSGCAGGTYWGALSPNSFVTAYDKAPNAQSITARCACAAPITAPPATLNVTPAAASLYLVPSPAGAASAQVPPIGNLAVPTPAQAISAASGAARNGAGQAGALAGNALGAAASGAGAVVAAADAGVAASQAAAQSGAQAAARAAAQAAGTVQSTAALPTLLSPLAQLLSPLNPASRNSIWLSLPEPTEEEPASEYVEVAFDWGFTLYQAVDTGSFDRDNWGFTVGDLQGLEGTHKATVSWYDGTGLLDRDEVEIRFDLADHQDSLPVPPPVGAPGDGVDAALARTDVDLDGIVDGIDNCPFKSNPAQADLDEDAAGDACDGDMDNDVIPNGLDNCVAVPNGDQAITHFPNPLGHGDACNPDWDDDGVPNTADTCPEIPDPGQEDVDADGVGDLCEGTAGAASAAKPLLQPAPVRDEVEVVAPQAQAAFSWRNADMYAMVAGLVLVAGLAVVLRRRR